MVVQTGERKWTYTDPTYPRHEVHITNYSGTGNWMWVVLGGPSRRIVGGVKKNAEFLDLLAIAADWIHDKGAET